MKQRIKNGLLALTIALTGALVTVPGLASAAGSFKDDACQGVNALNNSNSNKCDPNAGSSVSNLLTNVIKLLSIFIGFIAVIMVVVGGLKYITANGDSGALASARNTVIYALVGLVIVAIAQVLVHFVIRKVT